MLTVDCVSAGWVCATVDCACVVCSWEHQLFPPHRTVGPLFSWVRDGDRPTTQAAACNNITRLPMHSLRSLCPTPRQASHTGPPVTDSSPPCVYDQTSASLVTPVPIDVPHSLQNPRHFTPETSVRPFRSLISPSLSRDLYPIDTNLIRNTPFAVSLSHLHLPP